MLSLVVTFYDETPFLRTALRSIRNQGIDDLELIVVNDNPETFSEDDLLRLTDGFDARIVHHTENRGLSAARNTGIVAANGDFIGFLDADDYYTPQGLAAQYAYAIETQADITHAACYLGAESSVNAQILHRDAKLHMQKRCIRGRMAAQEAQFIVSSWSSLYRMQYLEDNELWFDAEQTKFEDRLFVINAVTAARSVAFLGRAVRVWRRRANSISSSQTTPETHLLQVMLLEKCMAHMRGQNLPPRFEKRELFNTVSRLIWDMDILDRLAADDPDYADMAQRIPALLRDDSFGHEIFKDPMVAATSRVGMRTRKGLISRTDFFALHKAWRTGDFKGAQQIMRAHETAAKPLAGHKHTQKRLVLHIGLHKTGSTFLQHHLVAHKDALRAQGVLVPDTGFDSAVAGRKGALSGHQGLVRALRTRDETVWKAFHDEVYASTARTVIVSAENLSFPTAPDRDDLIRQLFERLGTWASIETVAMMRAPHDYTEAFYAEWVASAHPGGARSYAETLVDHAGSLTDAPALFAPFEAETGAPVLLGDFDAARSGPGLWSSFCTLAGLPADLPERDVPRYPTPDRDSVRLMQLVNTVVTSRAKRQLIMDTYFAAPLPGTNKTSLIAPEARRDLIDRFEQSSAAFCAARGYTPVVAQWRAALEAEDWAPPGAVPPEHLAALLDVGAQVAGDVDPPSPVNDAGPKSKPRRKTKRHPYSFTIRLRPWVVRLLDRVFGK